MSQKQFDSRNWNNARQSLAEAYQRLNNRRKDYREKLASWDTQEYDAVFLEDLDVGSMMRQNNHSRNIASMSWYKLTRAFERHGEKHGCYVVKVPPERTTKRCAKCSVVWSRISHSGFENIPVHHVVMLWTEITIPRWRYTVLGWRSWEWTSIRVSCLMRLRSQ